MFIDIRNTFKKRERYKRVIVCQSSIRSRFAMMRQCGQGISKTKLSSKSHNDVSIEIFESAESFLDTNLAYDYLFLDVEMSEMNGIELKESLWLKNNDLGIIFITSHKELMNNAFGRNVLSFISKDELHKISSVLEKIEKADSMFAIMEKSGNMIDTRDILYLKASSNYTDAFMKTGDSLLISMSITQLLDELGNKVFVRIHRSFAVNIAHVKNISYKEVTLMNGKSIPLSRKYNTVFKAAFIKYLKER